MDLILPVLVVSLLSLSPGCHLQPEISPLNLILLTIDSPAADRESGTCNANGNGGDGEGRVGDGGCCSGVLDAVQLAVDDVRRDSTLLRGYPLTFSHYSASACNRREALNSLHIELLNGSVPDVAVLGAGCSLATEAVGQQARYYSLPVVSYNSMSGTLNDRRRFPYFSRTIPSGDLVAVGVASILRYYDWRRAVVITEEMVEFTTMTTRLFEELKDYDIDLREAVIPAMSSRFRRANLLPEGVRVFIIHTSANWARRILCNAFHSLDWRELQYVWLTQGWYEEGWWEGEGPADSTELNCTGAELQEFLYQQRVLGINHYPSTTNRMAVTIAGPMENGVIDRTGTPEDVITFSQTSSFVYDAVWAIALGLNATLAELSSACGNETRIEDFDPLGRDVESRDCVGDLLSDEIDGTTFEGVSGPVSFEDGSRRVEMITVVQYRKGSCLPVDSLLVSLSSSGAELSLDFAEGESNMTLWPAGVPADGSTHREVENFPYLWLWVVSYVVNSVVILAALVCLLFTFAFHNRKLVKLTSPNLNYLMLAGIIIFDLCTFMFVYPPVSQETLASFCSIRIWLVSIGITLCFGIINAKMFRIFLIFYKVQPAKKKRVIKDWYILVFILILIAIDLIVLIPTTASDSLRFKPVVVADVEHPGNFTDDQGTFSYVVSQCDSRYRAPILVFQFGYKVVVQIVGITLAVKMRNIQIKVLNDSKEMSLTLYLSSVLFFLVVVISFVLGDRLNVYGGSYAFGVPLSLLAVLTVVFFSKMVRLYQDPKGDKIFSHHSTSGVGTVMTAGLILGGPGNNSNRVAELLEKVKELEKKIARQQSKVSVPEATTSLTIENGVFAHEVDTTQNSDDVKISDDMKISDSSEKTFI